MNEMGIPYPMQMMNPMYQMPINPMDPYSYMMDPNYPNYMMDPNTYAYMQMNPMANPMQLINKPPVMIL